MCFSDNIDRNHFQGNVMLQKRRSKPKMNPQFSGLNVYEFNSLRVAGSRRPANARSLKRHPITVNFCERRRPGLISSQRSSLDISRQNSSDNGSFKKRFSKGKSTLILIVIVVLFVVTHANRLALKVYMTAFPQFNTRENFNSCLRLGR